VKNVRIIPRLDIKGSNLVKGIRLEGLRVLGKPFRFAEYYYKSGADELIYIDVVASLYGRNSLFDEIRQTARSLFIPLTVGGGLRTLEDIQNVLRAGADKACINTAGIRNPEFIRAASRKFGSSTIVVSIEVIKRDSGEYEAYTDNGRERTQLHPVSWAQRAEELGAGELLVTSIDKEGTGEGYDNNLIRSIAATVSIPTIACGGAGNLNHISDAVIEGKADAVSMASVLHYGYVTQFDSAADLDSEDDGAFLSGARQFTKVTPLTIDQIKNDLKAKNISCRI